MSIYEEIGGAEAVAAAVDDFYVRVLGDPALAPYFAGVDTGRLKAHQRGFIAVVLGGPEISAGRSMREAHARPAVTPEAFDRGVGHLVATLEGLGVPELSIGAIGARLLPLKAEIVAAKAA